MATPGMPNWLPSINASGTRKAASQIRVLDAFTMSPNATSNEESAVASTCNSPPTQKRAVRPLPLGVARAAQMGKRRQNAVGDVGREEANQIDRLASYGESRGEPRIPGNRYDQSIRLHRQDRARVGGEHVQRRSK